MIPDVLDYDVIVVGSGSAGLTAALVAACGGLRVLVCEKTSFLGGTTALSGGAIWAPLTRLAQQAGLEDSADACLAYLRACLTPEWMQAEEARLRVFMEQASAAVDFILRETPLRFSLLDTPDLYMQASGARARGRMITPDPLALRALGSMARRLRRPDFSHLFTFGEFLSRDPYHHPVRAVARLAPKLLSRALLGQRAQGTALVAGLLAGCVRAGVTLWTGAEVSHLEQGSGGRVTGARIARDGVVHVVAARRGLVLACGGFERDARRRREFFPEMQDFPDYVASPPGNTGDGHRMAEAAGALLGHMDQANISPAIPRRRAVSGHGPEAALEALSIYFHRDGNAMLVDADGQRFVDEMVPNMGEIMSGHDAGRRVAGPIWCIGDQRLLRKAPVLRWHLRGLDGWYHSAGTVEALATKIRVPFAALSETVGLYNRNCVDGQDQLSGVAGGRMPITDGPFVALPFARAFISTKGGPMTTLRGEVLHRDGGVIAGLYCAGVGMANPMGSRAVTLGTTLGPNLTWGYVCGMSLRDSSS